MGAAQVGKEGSWGQCKWGGRAHELFQPRRGHACGLSPLTVWVATHMMCGTPWGAAHHVPHMRHVPSYEGSVGVGGVTPWERPKAHGDSVDGVGGVI